MYKVFIKMDDRWIFQYRSADWASVMMYVTSLGDLLTKTKQLKIVFDEGRKRVKNIEKIG